MNSTVDRGDRLTRMDYLENGQSEDSTFDVVGNRESHTNRAEAVTSYGPVNPANEYADVGGTPVSYDEAGNLTVDEDGRQYAYDEHNRLIQVKAADETVLANYAYDALGRRISFEDPVAGVTTRYYYDGQRVVEERDGSDTRTRYLVNGAQYIDERIATYADSTPKRQGTGFTYYLMNQNYSIAGTGDDDGWVRGVRCIKMELGEPDDSGRRRPVPVKGSEFDIPCQVFIEAIGTRANPLLTQTTPGLKVNRWGYIEIDDNNMTSIPGVFAGGDIVRGAATVILAMGDGKTSAASIHQYLMNGQ